MPIQSRYPPLNLPKLHIFDFLFERKDQNFAEDKVIFQDGSSPNDYYTFKNVRDLATQFGQRLISEYGLCKGDRVMVVTPNDIDYAPVVYGILWAGAIVSPSNPTYTVSELSHQLQDSGSRLVIAHPLAVGTVKRACARIGISEDNILLLGKSTNNIGNFQHWKTLRECHHYKRRSRRPQLRPEADVAFLVYSSGTTGPPKGVMITHYNMTSNVLQITACEAGKLSTRGTKHFSGIPDAPPEGDKILACLPFFHIYGLTSLIMSPMCNGIHTVIMAKFEIETFCRLIQDMAITFIYIVPPQALLLAKHPSVSCYKLGSVRMANSGAAPLTKELQQAVFHRTGIRIKQGYGLSETSPTTHEQRWEDWDVNCGTIGRLQPNMEAKFCQVGDEDADEEHTKELELGQIGELYLRGPNVFKGYWKNNTATAACLSKDGWFRTGDVGYVDKNGDFYITDRVKELIKYKGFQVPPAELEGYLLEHDLVDDVAVVGVMSQKLGTEVPRAYVQRQGGMSAVRSGDEKEIMDWLAQKVVGHKKLRGGLKFVEAIPKSSSGKLLRRLLKKKAGEEFAQEEANSAIKALL